MKAGSRIKSKRHHYGGAAGGVSAGVAGYGGSLQPVGWLAAASGEMAAWRSVAAIS